ncbi:MAG: hypothetical protein U0Z75_10285 [Deinococcaceae bacterium]
MTPKDTAQNLSVYAYEMALNRFDLPPLNQVVSCESERKWDRPKKGKTQGHSRVLPKLTALQRLPSPVPRKHKLESLHSAFPSNKNKKGR